MAKKPLHYYKISKIQAEPGFYTVSKLDADLEPLASYHTGQANDRNRCSCPAYKRPCKHVGLVKKWLNAGEPAGLLNGLTEEFEDIINPEL